MEKKFDRSSLLPRFRAEIKENLLVLNQGVLALEKNAGDAQLIERLMRTAHTIKGSALIAGFKRIADLAHKFEDALGRIKEGALKPEDKHFDLLFQILDSIPPLLGSKISWPEKGVAFPHVVDLEKRIDAAFALTDEKGPAEPLDKGPAHPEFTFEEPGETIRVGAEKLDNLVNLAGELVISGIGLEQRTRELDELLSELEEFDEKISGLEGRVADELIKKSADIRSKLDRFGRDFSLINKRFGLVNSDLQEGVMKVRMLPLFTLFSVFPRSVRDLSRGEGKLIELEVQGAQTELDRSVLQVMEDPLMHIIRNAITHGIERPDERKTAGKPERGKITLSAYQQGGLVIIEVADDGKGINPEEIRERAVEQNLITQAEAREMSSWQVLQFLFSPGFTTVKEATQLAGRGVGLDVVRTNVARLKGQLEVTSEVNKGTQFTIKLPVTLAIIPALMVKSSGQIFAVPLSSVEETIRITTEEIGSIETKQAIQVRDKIIPLARLDDVLRLERKGLVEKKYRLAVIVRAIEKQLALVVDEMLGKQEIVVKTLGDHLARVNNIAGSTILGTGEVSLILDIPALIETAASIAGRPTPKPEIRKAQQAASVLVVDDSVTTAQSEQLILEGAGYKVSVARNGQDALQRLAEERPDLVVTDVIMPVMDGFALITEIKGNDSYKDIPVIMVTAKEGEADRKKGQELGADAYIAKSEFDQNILLDTVTGLIVKAKDGQR